MQFSAAEIVKYFLFGYNYKAGEIIAIDNRDATDLESFQSKSGRAYNGAGYGPVDHGEIGRNNSHRGL